MIQLKAMHGMQIILFQYIKAEVWFFQKNSLACFSSSFCHGSLARSGGVWFGKNIHCLEFGPLKSNRVELILTHPTPNFQTPLKGGLGWFEFHLFI